MYIGAIFTRWKNPTWAARNPFIVPHNHVIFVFDDQLAIAKAAATGDIVKGVGMVVGHGSSSVGTVIGRRQQHKLADRVSDFPSQLTVEELSAHIKGIHVLASENVVSVRIMTAVRPPTQLGGVDLKFRLTGKKLDSFVKGWGYYKHHVVSEIAPAVEALNRALPTKVRDDRFSWGKH